MIMNVQRPSTTSFTLPTAAQPGWESVSGEDSDKLKSIAESFILVQSLKQSRTKWLHNSFPKFSSKSRGGKAAEITPSPPPHTIQTRGRCDFEIGPHIFTETVFYEVHYLAPLTSYPAGQNYQSSNSGPNVWQAPLPFSGSYAPYSKHPINYAAPAPAPAPASAPVPATSTPTPTATPSAATSSEAGKSPTPLISSLTSVTAITPTLINKVNIAASSNPILANLLQLAAAGKASPDQLKTLGLLIQSLATVESTPLAPPSHAVPQLQGQVNTLPSVSAPTTMYTPVHHTTPAKEFDLVFEFRETPNERWIFPRGPIVMERVSTGGIDYDTLLTTRIPFEASKEPIVTNAPNTAGTGAELTVKDSTAPTGEQAPVQPSQVMTFRLKKTPYALSDTLLRWIGGEEKMNESRRTLSGLGSTERVFLGYQLPPGTLLNQLQSATIPQFNMKPLRQGQSMASRAARQRKNNNTRRVVAGDTIMQKRLEDESAPPALKKSRLSQSKNDKTAAQIQCISCNQTDVPLILGGRFCRPCVDAGRASINVLQPSTAPLFDSTGISVSVPMPAQKPIITPPTHPLEQ